MTVIKPEMLSREVTRYDLLPLSFIKKSPYTGSKGKLRYRIEKAEKEIPGEDSGTPAADAAVAAADEGRPAETRTVLRVSTWTGPNAWRETPAEEMRITDFDFSEAGLEEIIPYLNRLLQEI